MKKKRLLALMCAVSMIAGLFIPFGNDTVQARDKELSSEWVKETDDRSVINFNTDWHYNEGDVSGADAESFQDEEWRYVNLPHSTTFYTADNTAAYLGISWYRKHFTVDESFQGKKLLLTFEAAMQKSEVYLNGEHIWTQEGGYSPFVIDISDYVRYGMDNVIAVKIDSRPNNSFAPGKDKPDFQYFGGIYGNSYITVTDEVHVTDSVEADEVAGGGVFITAPEVDKDRAVVKVKTHVENETDNTKEVTLETELLDEEENVVATQENVMNIASGEAEYFTQSFEVTGDALRLWSPNTPELYTVRSIVKEDGAVKDVVDTAYGIRKVEWKRDGLYINDEEVDVEGANLHAETYMLGNAMPDNAIYEEIKRFKENGFDIIRMSHYPHRQAYYDACDKYGVMIVECASGWQYFNNSEAFKNSTYKELRTDIRHKRNHPSIVTWESSLNETGYTKEWATQMNRIVKEEYPQDGVSYAYTAGCYHWDVWDIGLSTPQAGIFGTGNEGANNSKYADKPMIIAEYGDWTYGGSGSTTRVTRENKNSYGRKGGDEGMLIQADNVQESVQTNRNRGENWLGASMYWDYADYAGFDIGTLTYCGVVDVYRIPKYAAYFYQSQRAADVDLSEYGLESGPMVYIANAWDMHADNTEVRIFSNCDTVELFVNGESIGEQGHDTIIWGPHGDGNPAGYPSGNSGKDISADKLRNAPITFDLSDYEAGRGELRAVAKIDGEEVAEYVRKAPEAATTIKLRPESDAAVPLDGSSAKLVWIDITDKNGTVVTDAYTDVNLEVEGPGVIVGPKTITTRGGQLAVWVRSRRGEGDITLTATGENLNSASVTIPTSEVSGLPEVPEGGDAYDYEEAQEEVTENIFLNKPSRASSENINSYKNERKENANDGSEADNSKWCASNGSYPQWWEVDLGAAYQLEEMNLSLETAGGTYHYQIAVSEEPMTDDNYMEHIVVDNSAGSKDTAFTFEDVKGRYVRVTFTEAYNGEWAVLREVSGKGETKNLAVNKPVSASTVNTGRYGLEKAEYAVDGNTQTWWCAQGGSNTSGHWITVDLKDTYKLSEIKVLFEQPSGGYKFALQGSVDGKNYKTIKDFRDGDYCGQETVVSTDKIIQYVRIYDITTDNMASKWPAIREIEVYGDKAEYKLSSISREKEASASSCKKDSQPAHGSNGVPGWYWYPATLGDEWWVIDTKGIYDLDNIQMTWNAGEEHKYTIEISTDAKTWTQVVDRSETGTDAVRPYEPVEGTARYIRMNLIGERAREQGFGLFDAYAPVPEGRVVAEVKAISDVVEVSKGTAFEMLPLPKEAEVVLADGIVTTLPIIWSKENYDSNAVGESVLTGTLETIAGVVLGEDTAVEVKVNVLNGGEKADKEDLAALIEYAKEAKEETSYKYVVAKVREIFEKAFADAIEANDKPDATQAEVDAAYDALLKTVHLLEFKGNMERLESLVVTAREETKEKYTPGSWAPFEKARQEAEDILAEGNTLQAEVDAARETLLQAIFGLREVPDKGKLDELLGKVKAMDLSVYSEGTASAVKAAYAKAMAVFEDENADQTKVDAAVAALEEAVAAANAEAGEEDASGNGSADDGSEKDHKIASNDAGSKGTANKTAGNTAAKTGDNANAAIPVAAGLVGIFMTVVAWKKKTNRA